MRFLSDAYACTPSGVGGKVENIVFALIVIGPLFYLSIPHWITNISIIVALIVITLSVFHKNYFHIYFKKNSLPFLLVFVVYLFSIIFSQLGRNEFVLREYLDQTRWIVGLPIFAFLLSYRFDFSKVLIKIAPLIVIFAWISSTFFLPSDAWGDRATISFMDPLSFGFINFSVSLVCLSTLLFQIKNRKFDLYFLLNLLGFLIGGYLSIRSGSRTGWLAFPIFMLIGVGYLFGTTPRGFIYTCAVTCVSMVSVLLFSDTVGERLHQFASEIMSYPWSGGVAPDTSVAMRITFYRLGWYYFSQSPWVGWGDKGYLSIKDAFEVVQFSSAYTRDFAFHALFHSEWTTQSVRFGVLGLASVATVFFVPLVAFAKGVRSKALPAMMGLAFILCQLVASLSTEVFSSKGMITFFVIIISGLLAELLRQEDLRAS